MTLGDWLKRNRKSQEWLAGEIDGTCTQALVSKWVRGLVLPSMPRQLAIQQVTLGEVSLRGMALRYRRTKTKTKARGEAFRRERGIM